MSHQERPSGIDQPHQALDPQAAPGRSGLRAFHVAFAVRDINEAVARFESVLGVSFHRPIYRETMIETPQNPTPTLRRLLLTYSHEGPPYFELLQDNAADAAEGIHHVGLWVPGVTEQRTRSEASGIGDELLIRHVDREGIRCWTNDPASLYGVRLEFFDQSWESTFNDWVQSDWYPEGEQPPGRADATAELGSQWC